MYKDGYRIRRIPEVVAHSGSALLHFYSDVAYNMTGFNISYRWVVYELLMMASDEELCFNPFMVICRSQHLGVVCLTL